MAIDRSKINPMQDYTIAETCERLDGIDRHTLLRYTNDGCIEPHFVSRGNGKKAKKMYSGQAILDYLDNKTGGLCQVL